MMYMKKAIYTCIGLLSVLNLPAQRLLPGFYKDEYIELMRVSIRSVADSAYASQFEAPKRFKMIYQSKPIALDNSWDLWQRDDGKAAISLRGTTTNPESWLENFYAAMVPATGTLQLEAGKEFKYILSNNPRAAVHVGWLVGMAFLAEEITPSIDSLYNTGVKDFFIMGHSQGGGIAYLLTAYLYHLQKTGQLADDIQFKTYCSAAPKPGNLFFAYDYEANTQNGWAYNVVNAVDWVPESPFSIQTIDDFNETNPFRYADAMIKQQRFAKRIALRHVYNKLDKPTRKAQANYEKYLGNMASKMVGKKIEGLKVPDFVSTNNYVRTGTTIVLMPDEQYYEKFSRDNTKIFNNHFHDAYLFLAEKLGTPFYEKDVQDVSGKWELNYISGTRIAFDGLYPDKKPFVSFDWRNSELNGNTSCNGFTSKLTLKAKAISIDPPLASTMIACEGDGELRFLHTLQKVTRYEATENMLSFYHNDVEILRFKKVE